MAATLPKTPLVSRGRAWQAHASDLAKKTGWKNRGSKHRARGMPVRWQRVPSGLAQLACRLKDAEIENRPALEVMGRFPGEACLYLCRSSLSSVN